MYNIDEDHVCDEVCQMTTSLGGLIDQVMMAYSRGLRKDGVQVPLMAMLDALVVNMSHLIAGIEEDEMRADCVKFYASRLEQAVENMHAVGEGATFYTLHDFHKGTETKQ